MVIYMNIKQIGKRKDVIGKIPFTYKKKPDTLREFIRETVTICVENYIRQMEQRETIREQEQIADMATVGKIAFNKNHAMIIGKRGNYIIHLGSGVVHQEGGPMINVLPVHSQRRGRIFLPFILEQIV